MDDVKDLVKIEKINTQDLFLKGHGVDDLLVEIRKKAFSHSQDVSTEEGRSIVRSVAFKITRSKTLLDGIGKDLVADQQKIVQRSQATRRKIRHYLDKLNNEYRKPLTEYEIEQERIQRENERKEQEKIDNRIYELARYNSSLPYQVVATMSDDEFEENLDFVKSKWENDQAKLEEERKRQEAEAEAERKRREEEAEEARKRQEDLVRREAEIAERERKTREEYRRLQKEKEKREDEERAKEDARLKKEQQEREAEAVRKRVEDYKARREALWPDREKMFDYVKRVEHDFSAVPDPELKTEEASRVFSEIKTEMKHLISKLKEIIEEKL